ncbi:MAG: magnesium transporter [Candidatus Loosdrechtia sp.]|uniref:magnesium transporter n=1 Tax=Candidatus Loosdrechtia sp. TaxID=3101272 RepID=UPI003A5F38A4|nr:MAG: magnesium transporter [Candidatus Jettenia sp. AMX2]
MDDLIRNSLLQNIHENKWQDIRNQVMKLSVPEIADVFLDIEPDSRLPVLRLLPEKVSVAVFSYIPSELQKELIEHLTTDEKRKLLSLMHPDDRTRLFEGMPDEVTKELLTLLSPEDLQESEELLGYPKESIGRLMTTEYLAVYPDWNIGQALGQIRRYGKLSETVNNMYVIDRHELLLGVITLTDVILSEPSDPIEKIMIKDIVTLNPYDDRERASEIMQEYDITILPVVDSNGVMLGIVTIDDVFDVAVEETTEDFQKSSAVTPFTTSYRGTSIFQLFHKRIVWLILLVFANLASSGVIATFEETLTSYIVLAFFIPLLIDSGGNAGSQSATLMIRSIATGDVAISQWFRTFMKEIGVGLTLGIAMGSAATVLGLFHGGYQIGLVVGISMMSIILIANLIGASLPFIFSRFKMDPAIASGPLVTTIVDVCGLFFYFTIARILLRV